MEKRGEVMFNKKRLEYSSRTVKIQVDPVLQDLINALIDLQGHKDAGSVVRAAVFQLAKNELGESRVDRINAETLKDYLDR